MSSTTTTTTTTAKRAFQELSRDELIAELEKRDVTIASLLKKAKKTAAASSDGAAGSTKASAAQPDPHLVAKKADKLRTMAYQQIKKQMKWKPACKRGSARFSWAAICDEPTFRAFLQLGAQDKTKGGKIPLEKFEDDIIGQNFHVSIRYGSLHLAGQHVNITYSKDAEEIKINGAYGV